MADTATSIAATYSYVHTYLTKLEHGDAFTPDEADHFLFAVAALHSNVRITFHRWWRTTTAEFVLAIYLGVLVTGGLAMAWNFFQPSEPSSPSDCSRYPSNAVHP